MRVGARIKHWFFGAYWMIAALAGAVLVVGLVFGHFEPDEVLTGLGLLLPFIYFVQKQKLEELALFRELFTDFNSRYDKINEKLNRLLAAGSRELTPGDKETLADYFNLCGEEFLYFRRGYVLPEVWKAWLNGMLVFYGSSSIKEYWDGELETESYYGLGKEIARAHALKVLPKPAIPSSDVERMRR